LAIESKIGALLGLQTLRLVAQNPIPDNKMCAVEFKSEKPSPDIGEVSQWIKSRVFTTHSVSGVDWKHYKHPLPENVYDVNMQYWGDVRLACEDARTDR
jgi:hypothetical protein